MELIPAIDLRDGRCVRLLKGDFAQETRYAVDPVALAEHYRSLGARWLHVVDLDAARTGQPRNRPTVEAMVEAVAGRARVQVGGGVRDRAAAEALFAVGVERVVLGTAAVENPGLVAELAAVHRVAVGIDARGGEAAIRGWTEAGGVSTSELLARFTDAGVDAAVVTDIGRDGTLSGPDLAGLAAVLATTTIPVIASGGVSGAADLQALARLESGGRRLAGAIVGKAIHDGRLSVEEALAACAA